MAKTKKENSSSKLKLKRNQANVTGKKSRSNHSMNPERKITGKVSGSGPKMRSKSTINRLRMYKNFKPTRDSKGHITKAAPFQEKLKSGTVARVEPHRKWFGNTRVVGQEQLQKFQEEMGKVLHDPFQVVMRQTRAPISLLQEKAKQQRVHILDTESFEHTFGKKAQRKKANLKAIDLETLCAEMEQKSSEYVKANDRSLVANQERRRENRVENPNPLFRAGQSARVWSELYKVIDSSDVLIEVLDARDPMGTRCHQVEQFLRKEKPHKHLVLVLNKVDLVPTWVTKKWMQTLSKELPTIAFHASIQHSFGKGSLISMLRQFFRLHRKERRQISIGLIGYPNVGKSSVVNTLRAKKVCKAAPLAGETKVWQYVTLMEGIYLIDCPGVVYPPHGDTETDLVLKGVVRVENVPDPENHIAAVLERVRTEYLTRHYDFVKWDKFAAKSVDGKCWSDTEDFMTKVALASGRLLRGGEPDLNTVARRILNDYQRGNLPHYIPPPGCEVTGLSEKQTEKSMQLLDERPINVTEQDDAFADDFGLKEEEMEGTSDQAVKEECAEQEDEDDPTGEKAILRSILESKKEREGTTKPREMGGVEAAKKEEDDEDRATDFEFELSTTDEEAGFESIGSDLDLEEEKESNPKTSSGKRGRGKRGGKKANKKISEESGKRGRRRKQTGNAANLLKATTKLADEKGVVNFGGVTKHDLPRNMWYKKLTKRRKVNHQQ